MNILINIGHPAHVHLFKNMITNLEKKGYIITIVTRDKDVTLKLLDVYGFNYIVMSSYYTTMLGKMYDFLKTDLKLLKIAIKTKPDVLIGVGDPYVAHIGKLIRKPSIVLTDTEHAKLANKLTFPFASVICTPCCFRNHLGKKNVRYNGYHELAYLHPNYFIPNPSVLDEIGLKRDETFIILRFVNWKASHDKGHSGMDMEVKRRIVNKIIGYGRVLITSEDTLPQEFEQFRINVTPEKLHDLLFYASLYIGEGATMATEAGILGTPSIYISSLVGTMGNFEELEKKYGLVYSFKNSNCAMDRAIEILSSDNIRDIWKNKREKLLNEKIDVTKFMIELIEKTCRNKNVQY